MTQPIEVRSIAQLERLVSWREALAEPTPVSLALSSPAGEELRIWEQRINRDVSACGCREGRIALGFVVPLCTVAWALGILRLEAGWRGAGEVFALLFATALLGKIAGLVLARLRLRRTVREIAEFLTGTSAPHPVRQPGHVCFH